MLVSGADAVVFAAAPVRGGGAARKDSVDRAASVLMADTAEQAGVRRFVQVLSMGAGGRRGRAATRFWAAYITAKTAAEADLRAGDLDWTILRPGIIFTLTTSECCQVVWPRRVNFGPGWAVSGLNWFR